MIWNLEQVKKKATESGRDLDTTASSGNDDCIVQVLTEHEHVIDVICWAPLEAAKVIQTSMYNAQNQFSSSVFSQSIAQQEDSGLLNDNDGKTDEADFMAVEVKEGAGAGEEEAGTRLTTKQRI